MSSLQSLILLGASLFALMVQPAHSESLTIAAAADLKFAMTEVVAGFQSKHSTDKIEVIYGSSGKFLAQISNGAPFDMFFSADIAYPRALEKLGLTEGKVQSYAIGRIVLWSLKPELAKTSLKTLPKAAVGKLAIANPQHAPYGLRAQEALQHEGAWEMMQPKLVLGENIAHATQFVDSGAAEAGIIALSLVLSPALRGKGTWTLIPSEWHQPLEQGFVITKRARHNSLAVDFARYISSEAARAVMRRYGFVLPNEKSKPVCPMPTC